jgi:hypothetical protein
MSAEVNDFRSPCLNAWASCFMATEVEFCWPKNSSPNPNGAMMPSLSLEDRAMGAFIGDALALGPH